MRKLTEKTKNYRYLLKTFLLSNINIQCLFSLSYFMTNNYIKEISVVKISLTA